MHPEGAVLSLEREPQPQPLPSLPSIDPGCLFPFFAMACLPLFLWRVRCGVGYGSCFSELSYSGSVPTARSTISVTGSCGQEDSMTLHTFSEFNAMLSDDLRQTVGECFL